jgi:hypothetical protein
VRSARRVGSRTWARAAPGPIPRATLALLLLSFGGALSAQDPPVRVAPCNGAIVSAIEFTARDPSFLGIPRGLRWLARATGVLHTASKPGAVGAFLLLEVGGPCTELARAESERILRVQPFLADATVRAVPSGSGTVRIEVETVDEIPVVLGMRFRDLTPSALKFGNDNVGGQGLALAGRVERGFAYRSGVGLEAAASQVLGRPYRVELRAERAPLESELSLAFGHPFFTDLQRAAWHMGIRNENRFSSFRRPEGPELSLRVRRTFWNVGVVRRLGQGRRRAFAGALVTRAVVNPADQVVIVSDTGLVRHESDALVTPAPAHRNLRLSAVLGVRALSFMRVTGFDALDAAQDVATGVQLGTLLGRGVGRFADEGPDVFVSTDLYIGFGSVRSFAAMQVEAEARRNTRVDRWEDIVFGGRLAWYVKPASAHVVIGSVEAGGVSRSRIPFQLTLGDPPGGVRGYAASRVAGAWRGVARLESRWSVGDLGSRAGLGVAAYADAGTVWAGEAPFGVDSRPRIGVGIGLLVAVPARSRRLWRLDVAVPVSADRHAGWEIRLTSVWTRGFWREPRDIGRARAGVAPSSIFTW